MIELTRRNGRPLCIGHKGAAALAPENTLRSLARALELGVDVVEFDVLDVRDELVLAHSDDLWEVSHGGGRGRVRGHTLAELRRVAPELPTLDEALAFLAQGATGPGLHVDLKWIGYEQRVVEALRRHGLAERTVVSSFFWRSLRAVGALAPEVRTGLSYPWDRRGLSRRRLLAPAVWGAVVALRRALPGRIEAWLERAGATAAMLHYRVVSRSVVERCHARGAAVVAWTVDDPVALRVLDEAGVDGVVTNDPRIFEATLCA